MKVKILRSNVGMHIAFHKDQIVERTPQNAERIDSLLRHGGAEVVDEPKKKVDEGGVSGEDTHLLHDLPTGRRGRKGSNKTKGG